MEPSEETFRKNIQMFSQILPEVGLRLQYVDASELEYCKTRQDELNLVREKDGQKFIYHSSYSAKKEAEKWFAKLDLAEHIDVLYIFGVGLGYYYDAVKPWLSDDPGRYVVFVEDDMSVLRRLFETENGTKILEDRQVQLHYFQDLEHAGVMMDWVSWYFLQMHPDVAAIDCYERERGDFFCEFRQRLLHDTVVKEQLASEYMRFGKPFFRSYFNNILYLHESYHGSQLFGKFKDVPAIICGAGPSLNKNLDQLGDLVDQSLVLCGGSSLNAVSYKGILPHFSAGVDPNPPQQTRLMANFAYEVPFFYRQRMYHRAFRSIHGPSLFLNGTGGYKIAEYFEKELGIKGKVCDEGFNVINLCIDIARLMGCNPIILVGMDLAYTDMRSYASGILTDENVSKDSILNVYDLEGGAFQRKDIFGKDVYTLWKWISESEWIGQYADAHPETTFINCTEGGIGFPGIPNESLKETAERLLNTRYNLWDRVHGEIQNARFEGLTAEKIQGVVRKLHDSIKDCKENIEGLLEEITEMENMVKKGKQVPHNLQTGKAALYDTELSSSDGYIYILGILGMVHSKILERRAYQIRHDWTLRSATERNLEMLKINREKCQFLLDASNAISEIIEDSINRYADKGFDVGAYLEPEESEVSAKGEEAQV